MKKLVLALSAVSLLATAAPSFAATCRDAKGKFIKCPAKPARAATCRNAKGKFTKCK
jgi:hypothetical protein